jgi:4-hydroxybenzoate polyprenyltransferase
MVDRDDDLKIGMKTSAITLGRFDVAAIVVFYLVFVLIWVLALVPLQLGAIFYVAIAGVLAQVAWHGWLIRGRTRAGCFRAFRMNHWIGCTLFVGIAAGYAMRRLLLNDSY